MGLPKARALGHDLLIAGNDPGEIHHLGPGTQSKVGRRIKKNAKPPELFWKAGGNLRFPLDKTYHGCPRNEK
jgi:hypothetical protein